MELKLIRSALMPTYTIGNLYIDGKYFCDTIEDKVRVLEKKEDKVYGETAIPFGEYKVIMSKSPKYTEKGKTDSYYAKFGGIMPELVDVPFFSGIRIHSGTTEKDSLGCIIVGENKAKGKVLNSRATFQTLWLKLNASWHNDDPITIKIVKK